MSLNGSKRYFSWKKAYAIIFEKFQVISSNFDKLIYFTPDFPTNQIMDWDLDNGEILKTYKNEFEWLKRYYSWKKAYAIPFWKVSSDFKQFLTSYYISHQTSPQTKSWMGLRQGRNSENLQKWIWLAWNDFFRERRLTRSFLQSFKWFQAILTSYHISHVTSPNTKLWIGT